MVMELRAALWASAGSGLPSVEEAGSREGGVVSIFGGKHENIPHPPAHHYLHRDNVACGDAGRRQQPAPPRLLSAPCPSCSGIDLSLVLLDFSKSRGQGEVTLMTTTDARSSRSTVTVTSEGPAKMAARYSLCLVSEAL